VATTTDPQAIESALRAVLPPDSPSDLTNIAQALAALLDGRLSPEEGQASLAAAGWAALARELAGKSLVQTIGEEHSQKWVLAKLAPHLLEYASPAEALTAARAIQNVERRSWVLATLAEKLPAEERAGVLHEALEGLLSIGNEVERAWAISWSGRLLSAPLLRRALRAARAVKHKGSRTIALAGIAPYLPAGERGRTVSQVLRAAGSIREEEIRAEVLGHLARTLSAEERGPALRQALEAAEEIGYIGKQAELLAELTPFLEADERTLALHKALRHAGEKAQSVGESPLADALKWLGPRLAEVGAAGEFLKALATIRSRKDRAAALGETPRHLTADQLRQTLDLVRAISDDASRAKTLVALVPHLTSVEVGTAAHKALRASAAVPDGGGLWSRALAALAPRLAEGGRGARVLEGLAAARYTLDEGPYGEALTQLAPHLPPQLRRKAFDLAWSMIEARGRARTLGRLAPLLPDDLQRKVVELAEDEEGECRSEALIGLAACRPPGERDRVLRQAMETVNSIEKGWRQDRAFAWLLPHLEGSLFREAVELALAADGGKRRANVLAALAPHLPVSQYGPDLRAAFQEARSLADTERGPWLLADLAPYQLEDERGPALMEAFRALQSVDDERRRAFPIAELVPWLGQHGYVGEALEGALQICEFHEKLRAEALGTGSLLALALGAAVPYLDTEPLQFTLRLGSSLEVAALNGVVQDDQPVERALGVVGLWWVRHWNGSCCGRLVTGAERLRRVSDGDGFSQRFA
jgi:hypothetical protein